MGTLREYFDTDPRTHTTHQEWGFAHPDGRSASILAKIALHLESNAKHWYFFVPRESISFIPLLLSMELTRACLLDGIEFAIREGPGDDYEPEVRSDSALFTRRTALYVDHEMSLEERRDIEELGARQGLDVVIRDKGYARQRTEEETPLAFISHDSRDKDSLVRDLAKELARLRCPVWYDEYSLRVGDSLRESIERGLRETRRCILVFSPHFIANDGWPRVEFEAVFTREILERTNVVLPVWHGVTRQEVYAYSPSLANRFALDSGIGIPELASRLASVIKNPR